ncbi:MAG TPA: oxygen-independent coproporphyrinogen III oxidase [Xanthomonadales bacterium]|nr:oxygen-independent coproporphyrinogen III oxidase [Xanthomonadales bacterium]
MSALDHAPRFDAALLTRYDHAGPRYTSYPTAPHFHAGFGEAEYRAQAQASNGEPIPRSLSLYVHVPFCESPCFYCGCTRIITRDHSRADTYLERLHREIGLQGELFDRDRKVQQLHFGGGTPNFLDARQMHALLDAISGSFTLERGDARQFSIEIDPRHADAATMRQLASLGFNRASFGVQDLDPRVQAAINRIQPLERTLDVVDGGRAAGFRSLSVDLIYGLPLQTRDAFARTVEQVAAFRPDRVALYSYAHLPDVFKAQKQIRAEDLPDPATKLALFGDALAALTSAGYRYIGMDHFALPDDELSRAQDDGTLQRNFQGYSTHADCDLVGLGVSSIGRIGDAYAQNSRDLVGYYAALDNHRLPVVKGLVMDADDRVRGAAIQALMCLGTLDVRAFERRHGVDFATYFADSLERLAPLAADGLVALSPGRIDVTPRGRLLLRPIAMCFDAWLGRPIARPRFSRVI